MMWNGKRYYSLDCYLKKQFGCKVYKLSLNGGMTCPNRDGTLGTSGCIFCSSGGSGDFAPSPGKGILAQLEEAKLRVRKKISNGRYIAYFQAYTNTYAPASYLEELFTAAMEPDDVAAISIATRPDCIQEETYDLLAELTKKKPVFVELGLQTIHETSASFIRRGYTLPIFEESVLRLHTLGILTVVHLILGLPNETKWDILESVKHVTALPIHGIKLSLLHILKGTGLETVYLDQPELFPLLDKDSYIDCLIDCLEWIPDHIVIHRITGDGPKHLLLAPMWSADKKQTMNDIQRELTVRNSYQGSKRYREGK